MCYVTVKPVVKVHNISSVFSADSQPEDLTAVEIRYNAQVERRI